MAFLLIALAVSGCGTDQAENENGGWPALFEITKNASGRDALAGRQWELVELEGEKPDRAESQRPEIHFYLEKNGSRFTGFAGCNTFSGKYRLKWGRRIRFTAMVKSMDVCPDVSFDERQLFETLQLADNYAMDGDTLYLKFGRRASLAVFAAEPVSVPADAGNRLAEEGGLGKVQR